MRLIRLILVTCWLFNTTLIYVLHAEVKDFQCVKSLQSSSKVSFGELRQALTVISDPSIRYRIHRNEIQEALWLAEKEGHKNSANILRLYLDSALRNSRVESIVPIPRGGASESYYVYLQGGLKGIFKPRAEDWKIKSADFSGWLSNVNAEVDTYRVARLLDLPYVPVTVERTIDGMWGSLQIFIIQDRTKINRPNLQVMTALDFLINNWDRHRGNYLSFGEHPVPIDHGMAFQPSQNSRGGSPPWDLDAFSFDEATLPLFKTLSSSDFEKNLRAILADRYSEDLIESILDRRSQMLKAMELIYQNEKLIEQEAS